MKFVKENLSKNLYLRGQKTFDMKFVKENLVV